MDLSNILLFLLLVKMRSVLSIAVGHSVCDFFPVQFFVTFLEQRIFSFELWILVVRFLLLLSSIHLCRPAAKRKEFSYLSCEFHLPIRLSFALHLMISIDWMWAERDIIFPNDGNRGRNP
jgi:hypothetical protein